MDKFSNADNLENMLQDISSDAISPELHQQILNYVRSQEQVQTRITASPFKANVVSIRHLDDTITGAIYIRFILYNQEGQIIALQDAQFSMQPRRRRRRPAEVAGANKKDANSAPDPKTAEPEEIPIPLELDPKVKKRLQAGLVPSNQELVRLLKQPTVTEPLSLASGEILAAWAQAEKAQLVACLPDDAFEHGFQPGIRTTQDARRLFLKGKVTEGEVAGGWIHIRPTDPDWSAKIRQNRKSLQDLIEAAEKVIVLPLDTQADFAFANPYGNFNGLLRGYQDAMQRLPLGGVVVHWSDFWSMLRLFGSLPPAQRQQLRAGERLPFDQLTQASRAVLEEFVYGVSAQFESGSLPPSQSSDDWLRELMNGRSLKTTQTWLNEPTEAMPGSLPPGGYLESEVTKSSALVLYNGDSPLEKGTAHPYSIPSYALLHMSEMDSPSGDSDFPKSAYIGSTVNMKFVFHFDPALRIRSELDDSDFPANSKPQSLSKLPPKLAAELKDSRAQLRFRMRVWQAIREHLKRKAEERKAQQGMPPASSPNP